MYVGEKYDSQERKFTGEKKWSCEIWPQIYVCGPAQFTGKMCETVLLFANVVICPVIDRACLFHESFSMP